MRLLLVEDDSLLGDGIRTVLGQSGWTLDWVQDGASADEALQSTEYAVVLLDLSLPRLSGLEVLRRLRSRGDHVPVLVISARDQVPDRVSALDRGADDYVVKPFDVDELCARVRALRRRASGEAAPLLRSGPLVLDPASWQVMLKGEPVSLSRKEFALLQRLMQSPGRVFARQSLEEALYGWGEEVASNAIEVHVHHLRKKLGAGLIRTVRGVGYVLEQAE